MRRQRPLLSAGVLGAVLLLGSAPGTVAEEAISGLRVGSQQGITRIVLNLSGPVRYRAFESGPPWRVTLEFPEVTWSMARRVRLSQTGAVRGVRFHANRRGPQRVVFVLGRPMRVQKSFSLKPGRFTRSWRVVVDLEPLSVDAFERMMRRRGTWKGRTRTKTGPRPRVHARPTLRPAEDRRPLVFIDPGHGGRDTGAVNRFGTREKDIVLRFVRRLRTELRTNGRYRVAFSRTGDTYVPMRERFRMAQRRRADLFISIHADSNPVTNLTGMTIYTVASRASDDASAARAKRENKSDAAAGLKLARPGPISGFQRGTPEWHNLVKSRRFARILVGQMKGVTPLAYRPLRFAGFAVLRAPDVPSVLLELGFLTNKKDSQRLTDDPHMRKVARAIVKALDRYFERTLPRAGLTLTPSAGGN